MGLTPAQMRAAIIANLEKKTGRTFQEWLTLVKTGDFPDRRSRVAWLRDQGIGSVAINTILWEAERPEGYVEPVGDELLAAQYAGPKASLLPLYQQLTGEVRTFGSDVLLDPRKTYVSLIRTTQFGLIQASTRARIDVGLKLKGVEPTERLRLAGSFGSGGVTHRVEVLSQDDIDEELIGWLRRAYALNR